MCDTRFACEAQRDGRHRTALVTSAAQHIGGGGDVSLGFYLERPSYLSLALVTCLPGHRHLELRSPLA